MKKKTKLKVLNFIVNTMEFAAILGSGVIFGLAAGNAADKVLTNKK